MGQSVSASNSKDYRMALQSGQIYRADRLEALTRAVGLEPQALHRSVDQ